MRGKIKKNTEKNVRLGGRSKIMVEVMFNAKGALSAQNSFILITYSRTGIFEADFKLEFLSTWSKHRHGIYNNFHHYFHYFVLLHLHIFIIKIRLRQCERKQRPTYIIIDVVAKSRREGRARVKNRCQIDSPDWICVAWTRYLLLVSKASSIIDDFWPPPALVGNMNKTRLDLARMR